MADCRNVPADSTTRFTDRMEDYVRYRPSYPPQVLETLRDECGLTRASVIADIGSGTGILTRLLIDHGNQVFGVEPNEAMRARAEASLAQFPGFVSVPAAAEQTALEPGSIDLITAAQAFRWFAATPCRLEFRRILRPGGWIVLIWNERRVDTTPFLQGYEELLQQFSTDYASVDHRNIDENTLTRFFGHSDFGLRTFDNI